VQRQQYRPLQPAEPPQRRHILSREPNAEVYAGRGAVAGVERRDEVARGDERPLCDEGHDRLDGDE